MTQALLAEDEPLLAQAFATTLQELWPSLTLLHAANGKEALALALKELPELLFLDIQMPVMTGIEVAQALAEQWPDERTPPVIIFVTAYDAYALKAFEARALDYLLKPVEPIRLTETITRIKQRLAQSSTANTVAGIEAMFTQLRGLSTTPLQATPKLKHLSVSVGKQVLLLPIEDVALFEAADKYVRLLTHANKEYLIRTPLKDLLPGLDADAFWQVHRGTIVAVKAVHAAVRQEDGRMHLVLNGLDERPVVSRIYEGLFRAM
jgi:DNA-binding LytR/AlgR family response regulator